MMRPMTLGEIAAAVGCTDSYFLDNNAKITSISTDSRPQPEDGDRESCLFVALRGEGSLMDTRMWVRLCAIRRSMRWWIKKVQKNTARSCRHSS